MVWPTVPVVTTNMDGSTDDPSAARSDILDLTTKFNDLIAMRAVANGVASLDSGTKVPVAQLPAATATASGISERAIQAEVDAGTDASRHVTPATLAGKIPLLMTVLDIGDWDMDTTDYITIAHSLTSSNVRVLQAVIRNDAGSHYGFGAFNFSETVQQYINITPTLVVIRRGLGGFFDSADFNATSYNRGWITILHTP